MTAAAAAVSLAVFLFPSLVAGNDLNLGEIWGRELSAFRTGDQYVEEL